MLWLADVIEMIYNYVKDGTEVEGFTPHLKGFVDYVFGEAVQKLRSEPDLESDVKGAGGFTDLATAAAKMYLDKYPDKFAKDSSESEEVVENLVEGNDKISVGSRVTVVKSNDIYNGFGGIVTWVGDGQATVDFDEAKPVESNLFDISQLSLDEKIGLEEAEDLERALDIVNSTAFDRDDVKKFLADLLTDTQVDSLLKFLVSDEDDSLTEAWADLPKELQNDAVRKALNKAGLDIENSRFAPASADQFRKGGFYINSAGKVYDGSVEMSGKEKRAMKELPTFELLGYQQTTDDIKAQRADAKKGSDLDPSSPNHRHDGSRNWMGDEIDKSGYISKVDDLLNKLRDNGVDKSVTDVVDNAKKAFEKLIDDVSKGMKNRWMDKSTGKDNEGTFMLRQDMDDVAEKIYNAASVAEKISGFGAEAYSKEYAEGEEKPYNYDNMIKYIEKYGSFDKALATLIYFNLQSEYGAYGYMKRVKDNLSKTNESAILESVTDFRDDVERCLINDISKEVKSLSAQPVRINGEISKYIIDVDLKDDVDITNIANLLTNCVGGGDARCEGNTITITKGDTYGVVMNESGETDKEYSTLIGRFLELASDSAFRIGDYGVTTPPKTIEQVEWQGDKIEAIKGVLDDLHSFILKLDVPHDKNALTEAVVASQLDFAHTQLAKVQADIQSVSDLKAMDTSNKIYTDLLVAYDKIVEILSKEIANQPIGTVLGTDAEAVGLGDEEIVVPAEDEAIEEPVGTDADLPPVEGEEVEEE